MRDTNRTNKVLAQLKQTIWWLGISAWLFSAADRGLAAIADGSLSLTETLTMLAVSFLFISWLSLKPEVCEKSDDVESSVSPSEQTAIAPVIMPTVDDLESTRRRMAELQDCHLISQSYILPFPYLAQIYHLLNLKHLETIHSFSLNNLKVVEVSSVESTEQGGIVRFQTVLDSPFNVLRIWRQPVVEVKLTLHNPYTVELEIPVYGSKSIHVMFSAVPLTHTEHQFYIDIYSNLLWYRPLLKLLLHSASVLTLVEDLPYLQALTQKVQRLVTSERDVARVNNSASNKEMWLYGRFISLYSLAAAELAESNAA